MVIRKLCGGQREATVAWRRGLEPPGVSGWSMGDTPVSLAATVSSPGTGHSGRFMLRPGTGPVESVEARSDGLNGWVASFSVISIHLGVFFFLWTYQGQGFT